MGQSKAYEKNTNTVVASNTASKSDPGKTDGPNPLDRVVITFDPNLDNIESKNRLTNKAATAKKLFSGYRKIH